MSNEIKVSYEYEKTPDSEERLQEIFEFLLKEPLRNEETHRHIG